MLGYAEKSLAVQAQKSRAVPRKTLSGYISRESRVQHPKGTSCGRQFRLKKPGGAGVKLFQAILAVNRDPGGTPVPAGASRCLDKSDVLL